MSVAMWLLEVDAAATCWCGQPPIGGRLGQAVHGEWVPTHVCAECPDHCALEWTARRCRFALCRRDATALVERSGGALKVCDLHVMPAARWGAVSRGRAVVVQSLPSGLPAA